jgi:hypothetical protein
MYHARITNNLFLSEVKVPVSAQKARTPTNHIWVIDRSGSMSDTIVGLVNDLSAKAREVKAGDTVTIGWFSGEGQHDWAIKGFRVSGDSDFTIIDKALVGLRSTLGTTCFSEVLRSVDRVLTDLSIFSDSFQFSLFTDGYPVVSNYQKEVDAIMAAVQNVNGRIGSSLLVGYGHYYNKELMSKMAEKIGGILIHSSSIAQYSASLSEFLTQENTGNRKTVDLGLDLDESSVVFTIGDKFVTAVSPGPDGTVTVSGDADCVYAVTKHPAVGSLSVGSSEMLAPHYAAAMLFIQRAKPDVALELIGATGDKALIDAISNSYSQDEYGKVEAKLLMAARPLGSIKQYPDGVRFSAGKVSDYLPKADAFCLLDLLDLLDSAYFYPTHHSFRYQRIGKSQEISQDYPKFVADPNARSKIGSLTWNDTKLNLSVLTKIGGSVTLLPKTVDGQMLVAEEVGLSSTYPTHVWRNFTIVKDGNLNVSVLPVSVTKEAHLALFTQGLIDDNTWCDGTIYSVHIDRIPVVNRSIANGRTSGKALCEKVLEEHRLRASLKALKWLRDQNMVEGEQSPKTPLSVLQTKLLQANGVDPVKNVFSPPVSHAKSTDFYMAKTFDIKVAGLSSLPKVEDVIAKVDGGQKKATKADTLVFAGVEAFRKAGLDNMPVAVKDSWLTDAIDKLTVELAAVRRYVQETKFAVVLGKKWFDEFPSLAETELAVGDQRFTFELGEQKVFF